MSEVPQRIEVDGSSVAFTWEDGEVSRFSAAELRAACECAICREPQGMEATRAVLAGADPVTVDDARLVGGYAIAFTFAPDGHGTGIYPFQRLRSLASGSDASN
jgi:DUF971 family protein